MCVILLLSLQFVNLVEMRKKMNRLNLNRNGKIARSSTIWPFSSVFFIHQLYQIIIDLLNRILERIFSFISDIAFV